MLRLPVILNGEKTTSTLVERLDSTSCRIQAKQKMEGNGVDRKSRFFPNGAESTIRF